MSPPTLGYANPAVFYAGVYRHRSAGALAGIVAFAAFGLGAGWVACGHPMDPGARFPLFGLAAVFLFGAGYLATMAAANRADAVRVTEDGIEHGRRFWPWARVASLTGALTRGGGGRDDGVVIEFTTRRGGLKFTRPLLTTPPLTPDQFSRLAAYPRTASA